MTHGRGIDTIVFTGVATNLSVEGTAPRGMSDACSAADDATHDAVLGTLVEATGMALSLLLPFDGRDQYRMPTTGGLGVNTGIQDSFDLAWKLDAVLSGWGGESLLDTYDPERRAAVTRSAGLASSIYQDWVETRLHIPAPLGYHYAESSIDAEPEAGEAMTAAACSRGMPLTAVAVTDRAVVAAIRIAYERRFVLVRPDGHVAWRGDQLPDDPGAVLDIVRGAAVGASRLARCDRACGGPRPDLRLTTPSSPVGGICRVLNAA